MAPRGKLSPSSHALIGAGHMGGALLNSWIVRGGQDKLDPATILVIDPSPASASKRALALGVRFSSQLTKGAASGLKLCLLAIKPQIFDTVADDLHATLPRDVLVVSIMAGIGLNQLKSALAPRPIIRAMPNTPAAIGKGMTAFVCSDGVSDAQKTMAEACFKPTGKVVEVDEEGQIDAVTAISGSGPAYVFHLSEAMAKAGMKLGLSEERARMLARETVIGAGAMLDRSDQTAADLRKAVTSPGGTTEAALKILMGEDGMEEILERATHAAYERSKELGK